MTPSLCFSPTRNLARGGGGKREAFLPLLHNSHLYLCRHSSSSFFSDTHIFKTEDKHGCSTLLFKAQPPKSFFLNLRPRNLKFINPSATLSSFAEAGDEGEELQETNNRSGMAKAFNISSNTAYAISICIAVAALTLPFLMKTLSLNLSLKTKVLSYVTLLFGFYMAWNIGANDVANAMGTSVGSGALTLRQAVMTAAVLEFSGALLMGTHVSSTMQKGIVVASVFQGKDSLLFIGLLSSLAASGTWLQVHLQNP